MIDKREIRIGNIIDFEYGSTDRVRVDGLFQIEGTWFVMWTKISGNGGFDRGDSILEDFKPIPLTPDILEKAGFKFEVYGHDGEQEVSAVRICSNIEINNKLMVWANNEEVPHIKHLHQLQNLYFALTGKELEITL